eukprot:4006309-Pleurochrysis_carterae.AAC.4
MRHATTFKVGCSDNGSGLASSMTMISLSSLDGERATVELIVRCTAHRASFCPVGDPGADAQKKLADHSRFARIPSFGCLQGAVAVRPSRTVAWCCSVLCLLAYVLSHGEAHFMTNFRNR